MNQVILNSQFQVYFFGTVLRNNHTSISYGCQAGPQPLSEAEAEQEGVVCEQQL